MHNEISSESIKLDDENYKDKLIRYNELISYYRTEQSRAHNILQRINEGSFSGEARLKNQLLKINEELSVLHKEIELIGKTIGKTRRDTVKDISFEKIENNEFDAYRHNKSVEEYFDTIKEFISGKCDYDALLNKSILLDKNEFDIKGDVFFYENIDNSKMIKFNDGEKVYPTYGLNDLQSVIDLDRCSVADINQLKMIKNRLWFKCQMSINSVSSYDLHAKSAKYVSRENYHNIKKFDYFVKNYEEKFEMQEYEINEGSYHEKFGTIGFTIPKRYLKDFLDESEKRKDDIKEFNDNYQDN